MIGPPRSETRLAGPHGGALPCTRRQAGAAIVIALLVVGIIAALAASVLWRQDIWVSDVTLKRDLAAARLLARNGVDWAAAVLSADARLSAFDHAGEEWARRVPAMALEGGEVGGFLQEQNGKWNLNNLVRGGRAVPAEVEAFARLLQMLGLPPGLAHAVVDWLDADADTTGGGGAEDGYYLSLATPYRAANAPLSTVDELRRVRGFSRDSVEKLRPFVTALPEYTPINVNTASRPVLAAALTGAGNADLDQIMSRRDRIPYRDLSDLRSALARPDAIPDEGRVTTVSRYFLASVKARHGEATVELVSLLRRQPQRVDIVWQRYP